MWNRSGDRVWVGSDPDMSAPHPDAVQHATETFSRGVTVCLLCKSYVEHGEEIVVLRLASRSSLAPRTVAHRVCVEMSV